MPSRICCLTGSPLIHPADITPRTTLAAHCTCAQSSVNGDQAAHRHPD